MIKKFPNKATDSGIPVLTQVNNGDNAGDILISRNLDLKVKEGKIRPSQRILRTSTSEESDEPQDLPVAFTKFTGTVSAVTTTRWWCAAGTKIYQTGNIDTEFTEDPTASAPTDLDSAEADMTNYNSKFYVASGTKLYGRSQSAWSTISSGLANDKKLLAVYGDTLYIVEDGQQVLSMNTSETIASSGAAKTLNIDSAQNADLNISCVRTVSNGLWFGTINDKGES